MMNRSIAIGLLVSALLGVAGGVHAQAQPATPVYLKGGSTVLVTGYRQDGDFYVLQPNVVSMPELRIHRDEIVCIGAGCGGEPPQPQPQPQPQPKPQPPPPPPAPQIAIHGSNTIGAALMPALVKDFVGTLPGVTRFETQPGLVPEEIEIVAMGDDAAKQPPVLRVAIHSHGSDTAFTGLGSGAAQIGMASRRVKAEDLLVPGVAALGDLTSWGSEHVLALDGLVVIVNRNNPVSTLDLPTIARIFAGQVRDWSEVGPGQGPIRVYARDKQSGTFDTFKSLVLKAHEVDLTPAAERFESNEALSDKVAQDENGIGFTGFAYVGNTKALELRGACGMLFPPEPFTVKTEEYPLARRLFLYTPGPPANPQVKAVLDHALSDERHGLIADQGFINQGIDLVDYQHETPRLLEASRQPPQDSDPALLSALIDQIRQAQRASVTFRFLSGKSDLDNKARADIDRLARFLNKPAQRERRILLLGFADSVGTLAQNRELATRRANTVGAALAAAGVDEGRIARIGYGEIAPTACNTDQQGQHTNRRVEVWLTR